MEFLNLYLSILISRCLASVYADGNNSLDNQDSTSVLHVPREENLNLLSSAPSKTTTTRNKMSKNNDSNLFTTVGVNNVEVGSPRSSDIGNNAFEKQAAAITATEKIGFVETGAEYWITAVLQLPRWIDITNETFLNGIQLRLRNVIIAAVDRQQSRRYGVSGNQAAQSSLENSDFSVQLQNVSRPGRGNQVHIIFMTRNKQTPMPAATLVEDVRLLSAAEQSAIIGYPVIELKTYLADEETEKQNLWIIGAVIGFVLGVLLCGWCTLFAYYNTCGRLLNYSKEPADAKGPKAETSEQGTGKLETAATTSPMEDSRGRAQKGILKYSPPDDAMDENQNRQSGMVEKIYMVSTEIQTELVDGNQEDKRIEMPNQKEKQRLSDASIQSSIIGMLSGHRSGRRQTIADTLSLKTLSGGMESGKRIVAPSSRITLSPQQSVDRTCESKKRPDQVGDVGSAIGNLRFNISGSALSATPNDESEITKHSEISVTVPASGQANGTLDSFTTLRPQTGVSDIWTLYPWRPYQAFDNVHSLSQEFAQHPSPYQTIGADGSIVLHSKLLISGTTIPKNDAIVRRVNGGALLGLI